MGRKTILAKEGKTQINLMKGDIFRPEHWQAIKSLAVDLEQKGIGDGSMHNTLLYILAKILQLPTDGIFATDKSNTGFILYVPHDINQAIEREADRFGLRKDGTIASLLDIYLRQRKTQNNEMSDKSREIPEEEMKYFKTVDEFLNSNPNREKPPTRAAYNVAVNRGDIQPVMVPIGVRPMIDTRKYAVSDSGYRAFIRADGEEMPTRGQKGRKKKIKD